MRLMPIFDLSVKKDEGRHRANKPGLLFSVDYTPRLRLSPFGFKRNDEERERKIKGTARCFREERVALLENKPR